MVLNPSVQTKGQEEIDSFLVKQDKFLPTFEDMDNDALPYVSAIVKEVLRWHPVATLSMLSSQP
jgi:cytochrome P450